MKVLVDTSVWSLALRRPQPQVEGPALELAEIIREGRVAIIGSIRQELLSGIRDPDQCRGLRDRLRFFPDLLVGTPDYEEAAEYFNRCRSRGIQGSNTDFLICAVAVRRKMSIFTTDSDFTTFSTVLPIRLHQPKR